MEKLWICLWLLFQHVIVLVLYVFIYATLEYDVGLLWCWSFMRIETIIYGCVNPQPPYFNFLHPPLVADAVGTHRRVLGRRSQLLCWVTESLNSASRTITMHSLQRGTDGMGAWCPHSQPHDSEEFFLDYTVQLRHSQHTHTHTPMNTRTQTLLLWAFSKTEPANPRDWRSHHMRLAIYGNAAYHWMHNTVKSQNIRSHEESNPEPQVLLRLL